MNTSPLSGSRSLRRELSLVLVLSALSTVLLLAVTIIAFQALGDQAVVATVHAEASWAVQALPYLPWAAAWVLGVAAISVWRAWRLQAQFSAPLEALSTAAARVGQGALTTEMPSVGGVGEIKALRNAVEDARRRMVGTIADLDARRAELRNVLEHMTDGVLLLDAEGRLRTFNEGVRRIWEAAGARNLSPETGRRFDLVFPRLVDVQGDEPMEVPLGSGDEPGVVVKVSANALPGGERVLLLHDITREHELEAMERTFLSMVTHELKTPLTSIGGYTRLLLRGKGGALEPRGLQFVTVIDQEATKLHRMIQDLLDISRLESGRFPVERRSLRVTDLVDRVRDSALGTAEGAGIALVVRAEGLGDARICADLVRMEQVFGNLIGNALKFTEAGGRVTLTAWLEGARARFSVEDTGAGIPPGALRNLFEKFFQVDREDTRRVGGAGLGLYICRQLVQAHGGTIAVQSTVGEGTRFDLSFDLEAPHGTPQEAR